MRNRIKIWLLQGIVMSGIIATAIFAMGIILVLPGMLGYCVDPSCVLLYGLTIPVGICCMGICAGLRIGRNNNDEGR